MAHFFSEGGFTVLQVFGYTEIGEAGMQSLNAIIGLSESTANSSI